MSYVIPVRDISLEKRKDFRKVSIEYGTKRALAKGIARESDGLTIRELLPQDIGLKNWQVDLVDGRKNWVHSAVNQHAVVVIYKVMLLSPDPGATQLHTYAGPASRNGMFQLDSLYTEIPFWKMITDAIMSPEAREVMERMTGPPVKILPEIGAMEGYFSDVMVYDPQQIVRIDVVSTKVCTDMIVLGGFVIETAGFNII